MTRHEYSSPKGLYTIRIGHDVLHQGLEHAECSRLMDNYRDRYEELKDDPHAWPLEPHRMIVEPDR